MQSNIKEIIEHILKSVQEYLGITPTKEVILHLAVEYHKEPIAYLTDEELDQVIKIVEQIKERNR